MIKIMRREVRPEEPLYLGTAESEHIEMYLKVIWYIREKGEEVKVSTIAQLLNVTQPSVVQMLKKLDGLNLLKYAPREIQLTQEGEHVGKQMVRNTRLLEVLMRDALKIQIDEEMVCGIEHHMKHIFTEALCTLLITLDGVHTDMTYQRGHVVLKIKKKVMAGILKSNRTNYC